MQTEQYFMQKLEADNNIIISIQSLLFYTVSNNLMKFLGLIKLKKITLPTRFVKYLLVGENATTSKMMDCIRKLSCKRNYE